MFRNSRAVLALATLAVLVSATAATAAPARRDHTTGAHHRRHEHLRYEFRGTLAADAGANATSLVVQVTGGNRPALKAVIGAAQPLTFAVDAGTRYVWWSGGTPSLVSSDHLHAGDPVRISVAGSWGEPLAQILAQPAARVADLVAASRPHGRMFTFAGKADAVDTTKHTITIDVAWGNWRALYAMLGQPLTETFVYDSTTTFLHWDGSGPHVLDPAAITAGDPLTLRVFGPWRTPLATLEQTPLFRVTDHEPMPHAMDQTIQAPAS
jgi:hypothetical protein